MTHKIGQSQENTSFIGCTVKGTHIIIGISDRRILNKQVGSKEESQTITLTPSEKGVEDVIAERGRYVTNNQCRYSRAVLS